MKKILANIMFGLFACMIAMPAATLAADPITIYAGQKNGGYDKAAKKMATRLGQHGVPAVIENKAGSDDITLAACSVNEEATAVWIAQADALWKREQKGCVLPILSEYGDEMAMLLFPPKSKLHDLHDLTSDHSVFVGKVGSGFELTFSTMQKIEKEHGRKDAWSDAQKSDISQIKRATAMASRGEIHAALLVMKPTDKRLVKLLETGWSLGELNDKDINDLKFGDSPLYERVWLKVKAGDKVHKNYAYRVRSFIGTTEYAEYEDLETFDKLLEAIE